MSSPAQDPATRAVQEAIHSHWVLLLFQGLIMAVLGLAAIAEPVMATFAVTTFVGWLFVIIGIVGLALLPFPGVFGFWSRMIISVLAVVIGVFLIWRPFGGSVSLVFAAAVFFAAQGVAQFILAIGHRAQVTSWIWILLSSFVNFILAGVALSGVPDKAIWTLGLAFGINLVMWGLALAMTALACRTSPQPG
jgi:uncharacterized membrane protein HdeD (DUF308 family)